MVKVGLLKLKEIPVTHDRVVRICKRNLKNRFKKQNVFIEKLLKHLNKQEVELPDGSTVSNMDAIIENLVDKAVDGDIAIIKLIRDLLNGR